MFKLRKNMSILIKSKTLDTTDSNNSVKYINCESETPISYVKMLLIKV